MHINRNRHGFEIDLKPYLENDHPFKNCEMYSAFFGDMSSSPQIVRKNGGLRSTHYGYHGNAWYEESFTKGPQKLSEEAHSVEISALNKLKEAHDSL